MTISDLRSLPLFLLLFTLNPYGNNVQAQSHDTSGVQSPDTFSDVKNLYVVDQKPQFPGGKKTLYKYLNLSLQYPDSAQKAEKEGHVIVAFIIDRTGKVKNPQIISGVNKAFNEEVIRVVKNLPKWKPGVHNGEKVNVKYRIPITFNLD